MTLLHSITPPPPTTTASSSSCLCNLGCFLSFFMDFAVVGLDSLICSNSAAASNNGSFALENASEANKHRGFGSGFLKQERAITEADFRDFKVAKDSSSSGEKSLLQRTNSSNLSEGHQQQMLSFSSPNSQQVVGAATLPYYHHTSSGFSRCTGMKSSSMQGVLSGVRGPFTPSQWMELEHQALIYKYINANVAIPTYLLNPIRKAFESVGFSTFSGLRSNAFGWGTFHLGFSNTDPEPGRCRRTDGKKWRCSRDAVADQKYCERHMNRGRHRSRKPVEGQSGHAATSSVTSNNGKLTSMTSSTSASVVPGGGASNSLSFSHQQQLSKFQQAGADNRLPGLANINRSVLNKENTDGGYQQTFLSMTSAKSGPKDNQYSIPKQQNAEYQEFGLVCSDSLLNPLSRSYGISDNLNDQDNKSEHSLRQFMDDWPKNHPDRMQLSISIPMATSDFMSAKEKLGASPLRSSEDLEMGLGVGIIATENSQRRANWVPISWEPYIGGPLGEVLHSTSNTTGDSNITKPLNLMDNRDNTASPTGVLQRGPFGSLSNSSGGSSPRAENSKTLDGASFCNRLMNPSLPAR